jgi:membrane protein DedA with SNARE-associated domain
MEHHLIVLLGRYGALALFFAQAFGILGLPIPGELLLTIAGDLVRRGDMSASSTVAAAIGGSLTGVTSGYALGRLIGVRVLQYLPFIGRERFEDARSWVNRYGKSLLAISCFVPGVRHVVTIAAGSIPLDVRTFCVYAYPGTIVWSLMFLAIGYFGGAESRRQYGALLLHGHLVFAATILAALAVAYAYARRRMKSEV